MSYTGLWVRHGARGVAKAVQKTAPVRYTGRDVTGVTLKGSGRISLLCSTAALRCSALASAVHRLCGVRRCRLKRKFGQLPNEHTIGTVQLVSFSAEDVNFF